ncbi:MAG: GTP 3',8-cyclase MoaA [Turicibacter sp.]
MASLISLKATLQNIMKDRFEREIDYLRISVTDNCNLRCIYCMDDDQQQFLKSCQKISDEEILRIVEASVKLGIKKIRLTGGEPLVRPGIVELIGKINQIDGIEAIYLTSNGTLLANRVDELVENGLKGVNISLDSLKEDRFNTLTRRGELNKVLLFIDNCLANQLSVKLNTVIVDHLNKDEILDFVDLTLAMPIDVRFIELMPIGIGKVHDGVTTQDILDIIGTKFTYVREDLDVLTKGPATYIKVDGALGRVGFISAVSSCFCEDCNRIRVTADGFLKQCLHFKFGVNLRDLMREGISDEKLKLVIEETIFNKPEKHLFNKKDKNEEVKQMNQIGG